jgi:hypothetical protein
MLQCTVAGTEHAWACVDKYRYRSCTVEEAGPIRIQQYSGRSVVQDARERRRCVARPSCGEKEIEHNAQ